METIAARLAARASALASDRDPALVARALALLTDFLAVAVGGAGEPSSVAIREASRALASGGGATVIGTANQLDPAHAALANGAAAHALEMDDTFQPGSIHLGAPIVPAALATAERTGASGGRVLAGMIAGYEVAGRLAMALDPAAHYARGFHPTGTCGTFGAATAAAVVAGMDARGIETALGVAGSQAAGSMQFLDDGAWTKRLHPGWAALAGMHAAALAEAGFVAPSAIFEGRFGALHAYSDRTDAAALTGDDEPVLLRTSIKPHACCRYMQGPIDAALALRARHGIEPDDVDAIEVGIVAAGFPIVCEPAEAKRRPRSVVDAQFSLPFGIAVALVDGAAGPDRFTATRWGDTTVGQLMDRVTAVRDPALDAAYPSVWPSWVRIRTRSGRVIEEHVRHPKGDPERFLTAPELEAKLRALAGTRLGSERIARLLDAVGAFPSSPSCEALLRATTVT